MVVGIGAVASGPVLQTDRLELRLPQQGDLHATFALNAHPETARYLGATSAMQDHFTRFMRNAASWLTHGYGSFIVRRHGSDEVIGTIGVFHSWRGLGADFDDMPEAGWILHHDHVGQGLAQEAMDAVFDWFEHSHGPRRIVAMIEQGNVPSFTLASRLGFAPIRDAQLPDGTGMTLLERLPG
ncbi:MAG: hypothetical protein RLZZ08_283 [Pseudomonadota bacterium]|jgi:RimJ/RimL family protein N-acetyltransferase